MTSSCFCLTYFSLHCPLFLFLFFFKPTPMRLGQSLSPVHTAYILTLHLGLRVAWWGNSWEKLTCVSGFNHINERECSLLLAWRFLGAEGLRAVETLRYWFLGKRGKREVPRIFCSLRIVHKRTLDVPVIPFEGAGKGRRQEEWTPGQTPREDFSLTWEGHRCGCHFHTCFTKTPAPATLAS